MVIVKILSLGGPERYAVQRVVTAAARECMQEFPNLELETIEVSRPSEIAKYAFTLLLPTLIINEKIVCNSRFPTREEVIGWLREALKKAE